MQLVLAMSVRPLVLGTVVASALAVGCGHRLTDPSKLVSAAVRMAALRRAQVWKHTDVASMNIVAGPQGKGALKPGELIDCDYAKERLGGNTPKFACTRAGDDDQLKVRYGRENGEVYAGVAATRLLWALGYGADAVYPVHVVCRGCPETIVDDAPRSSGVTRFDIAAIERKFPGRDIESPQTGPGWAWPELDLVDQAEGGAPWAQRDALKLLAVFLQHTDSKAEQQRLVCLGEHKSDRDPADCAEPFMMIHDVGQTFGSANLFNRSTIGSVNYDAWSRTPIWKDPKRCVGNLAQSQTGTLIDPKISEAGRRFLADLLTQLTDHQIRDLFTVARFGDKPHGRSVDDWTELFKRKRQEITATTCPD